MPVGQRPTLNYYSFSKDRQGKIRHKDAGGNEEFYDFICGILTKIELVEDEFEGRKSMKYHFYFEDTAHTQTDVLQTGESSSAARGILLTLISCPDPIGRLYVAPYRKQYEGDTYTNVWVEVNGDKVDWRDEILDQIPEVRMVKLGDRKVADDGKRRKFFRKIAKHITTRKLHGGIAPADTGKVYGDAAEQASEQPAGSASQFSSQDFQPADDRPPETDLDGVDSGGELSMEGWEDLDDDLPF